MLQNPSAPYTFFGFTPQGVTLIIAVVGVGLKIIRILRKFDKNATLWLWEHEVMWEHHKENHEIPSFPNLARERRHTQSVYSVRRRSSDRKPKQENDDV